MGETASLMAEATALWIFFEAGERLLDGETGESSSDEDSVAAVRTRLARTGFSFAAGSVGLVLIMAVLVG
jgi:hypothetical protein